MNSEQPQGRSPQQAEELRRQKEIRRRKALRRYHILMTVLAVETVLSVIAIFFLVKTAVDWARGREEPVSSVSQQEALPPESAPEADSEAAPESEAEPVSSAAPEEPVPDPTKPADPALWSLLLANTTHPLPEGYEPTLASVGSNSRNGEQFMDERAAGPLLEMFEAARADGIELVARSAYRSTAEQRRLFESMKDSYMTKGMTEEQAFAETKKWRNEPGTSEHETGLAVDIVGAADINANLVESLEEREWAVWLRENAADYGFILRYMKDKTEFTGTTFEPWHYRYVGVEDAQKIMAQGVSLEEYLGMTE